MSIIYTEKLSKIFTSKKQAVNAVQQVDLSVEAGTIFGFLGPNGAGKTTTMRMLTTLLKPTSGIAFVVGHNLLTDPLRVRQNIGYVSQIGGLDNAITGRENLILQARLYNLSAIEADKHTEYLIQALDLGNFIDRRAATYSGGQRRRVDLALGIIHRPKLVFLDEPTLGLDPHSRTQLWQEIRALRNRGTTIFLTTHYLDEANSLCDTIAIINNGRIVAQDTPTMLKQQISGDIIRLTLVQLHELNQAAALLKTSCALKDVHILQEELNIHVESAGQSLSEIIRALDLARISIKTISLDRPTLDDVFLHQTSRPSYNQQQL